MPTLTSLTLPLLISLGNPFVSAANLYPRSASSVVEITPSNHHAILQQNNHSVLVEFYAPWCGHCQNLAPIYEKTARQLTHLAPVVAVNCDDESLKPLCARHEIKGFPTLKIVRPGKKRGKPSVSEYRGGRDVKSLVAATLDAQPNRVKRLNGTTEDWEAWLQKEGESEIDRIVLVSEKPAPAPIFKALAIDYLSSLSFGFLRQRKTQKDGQQAPAMISQFGVETLPSLVYFSRHSDAASAHDVHVHADGSGGGESHSSSSTSGQHMSVYAGEMSREKIVAWIKGEAGIEPNPPIESGPDERKSKEKAKIRKKSAKAGGKEKGNGKKEQTQTETKRRGRGEKKTVVESDKAGRGSSGGTPSVEPTIDEQRQAGEEEPPAPEPVEEVFESDGSIRDEL